MIFFTDKLYLSTKGNCEIVDITDRVSAILEKSDIKNGIMNIFVPGATGSVTTIEYEPGLITDFQNLLREIVKENKDYQHNKTHSDKNATSHLRASLLGATLSVPIENGQLTLGRWQQIVFVDMDNRPRDRKIIVKIIGD
ncbi:MAG: secondary thiamine-phosphate synthase enzyme YjbQ [Elusimicrobiota bacterium]